MKDAANNITPILCNIGQLIAPEGSTVIQNLDLSLTEEPRNIGERDEKSPDVDVSARHICYFIEIRLSNVYLLTVVDTSTFHLPKIVLYSKFFEK